MDTRKAQFEELLVEQRHAIIKAHGSWTRLLRARENLEKTPEWAAASPRCDKNNAEAEYTVDERAVSDITAQLARLALIAPASGTDSELLAVLDLVAQYGQAQVALSQTRTPNGRTAATAKALSIWDAIKTALQEG